MLQVVFQEFSRVLKLTSELFRNEPVDNDLAYNLYTLYGKLKILSILSCKLVPIL